MLRKDIESILTKNYENILKQVDFIEKQNEHLKKENEELKNEKWKDKEINNLKKKYDKVLKEYHLGFPISKEEDKKINEWIEKHIKEKHNNNYYAGCIGGRFSYHFTPTSIGTIGIVKCACGEEFIFQDI